MNIIRFKLLQAIFVNEFLTLNFRQNQVTTRTFFEQIATQFITKDIVQFNDISIDFFRAIITHLFQLLKNYAIKFIIKSKFEKEFASNSLNFFFFHVSNHKRHLDLFRNLLTNDLILSLISLWRYLQAKFLNLSTLRYMSNASMSEMSFKANFFTCTIFLRQRKTRQSSQRISSVRSWRRFCVIQNIFARAKIKWNDSVSKATRYKLKTSHNSSISAECSKLISLNKWNWSW